MMNCSRGTYPCTHIIDISDATCHSTANLPSGKGGTVSRVTNESCRVCKGVVSHNEGVISHTSMTLLMRRIEDCVACHE